MKKPFKLSHILSALMLCTAFASSTAFAECSCQCQHDLIQNAEDHFITKIAKSGSLIRIEDGSHWEVAFGYEHTALQWRSNDSIVITPNPYYFSRYKYAMRNLTTGTLVLVNLSLGPVVNGGYVTRQVIDVNLDQGLVSLSDGSSWLVSDKDFSLLSKWEPKDYIIVGVNNGTHYRNILINVTTNRYIAAESY